MKKIKPMKATLHYKNHINGISEIDTWIAKCKDGEFRLTEESHYPQGYTLTFEEGQEVEIEIIENYGIDFYDNQISGIDYYDAAKITKY